MTFAQALNEHLQCFERLSGIEEAVVSAAARLTAVLENGGKLLICGNGGSAADSQHFAAEIVGRFAKERQAWPAIALTTDTSILTAVANDYAFHQIFARQVEGIGSPGDLLIGISTSGNSENVIQAIKAAHHKNISTIALLGKHGGPISELAEWVIHAPATRTARIQEVHAFILHVWAEMIENTRGQGEPFSDTLP